MAEQNRNYYCICGWETWRGTVRLVSYLNKSITKVQCHQRFLCRTRSAYDLLIIKWILEAHLCIPTSDISGVICVGLVQFRGQDDPVTSGRTPALARLSTHPTATRTNIGQTSITDIDCYCSNACRLRFNPHFSYCGRNAVLFAGASKGMFFDTIHRFQF